MMIVLLTALVLVAPGLIVELLAARARAGHHNKNGFHFDRERAAKAEKFKWENPD